VRPEIRFDADSHTYEVLVDGEWQTDFPSVTTVVKATVPVPFSAGAWYGYKMGARAAFYTWDAERDALRYGSEFEPDFYEQVKKYENPNSVLTKAGDRGTLVHQAIEQYGLTGTAPDPQDFEPEDRKRIQGVASWLLEHEPEFHVQEVRTANVEFRYVGTFDALVTFGAGPHKGKLALLDWKTSKRVYPDQHFPQLAAYVAAEAEAHYPDGKPEFAAIVHIPESGRVKLHESHDTFEDFEVLLAQYRSAKAREARIKAAK
jgi:hypothetical protein